MQTVSDDYKAAVAGSHEVVLIADLWYGGMLTASNVPITAGRVTSDESQAIRGRLTCTIASQDSALFPIGTKGVGVYGHELHIRAGVRLPSGNSELVSLGWFRVQTVTVTERYTNGGTSAGLSIEVDAADRMARVDDYRFMAPEQPGAGATCLSEIRRLARGVVNLATWTGLIDGGVPSSLTYTDSRLDAINQLAATMNCYAFADPDGNLAVENRVNNGAAVWEYTAADIMATTYDLTRDGVFNAVVARGETADERVPLQATALDLTTGSILGWASPFGRVPYFMSSPILNTQAAVESAAITRLSNLVKDRDRLVTLEVAPNPALELGDNIRVTTPRASVIGRLTAYSMPLGPQSASLTLRVKETEFGS